jgi:hypothetical protein
MKWDNDSMGQETCSPRVGLREVDRSVHVKIPSSLLEAGRFVTLDIVVEERAKGGWRPAKDSRGTR